MARYTDLDKIIAKLDADTTDPNEMFPIHWMKTWLNMQPTADVAPKSEVDDWKEIAETYQKMFEDSYSKYQAEVDKLNSKLAKCQLDLRYSRNEVAREIFEEIEKLFVRFDNITVDGEKARWDMLPIRFINHSDFEELKKKYTEPDAE